jgi:hypothetical protein
VLADQQAVVNAVAEPQRAATVVEHDLHRILQSIPAEQRGYGEKSAPQPQEVQCKACRAISVFVGAVVGKHCDFCGSPSLVPHDKGGDAIRPQAVLPFRIDNGKSRELIRGWLGSHWFAPNKLKSAALIDQMHGVYLPYWTFDAHADAEFRAEAGEHYYVQVQGKSERRTRWSPTSGSLSHTFDDELIAGTVGTHAKLLSDIEPFDTQQGLQPYSAEFLRGWTVERYQLDLRRAAELNVERMHSDLVSQAKQQVLSRADEVRNVNLQANYRERTFKHVLLPVWIVNYTYGSKTKQVVVNGSTGKVAGEYPLSGWKIFFYVVLPLMVLAYLFLSSSK